MVLTGATITAAASTGGLLVMVKVYTMGYAPSSVLLLRLVHSNVQLRKGNIGMFHLLTLPNWSPVCLLIVSQLCPIH